MGAVKATAEKSSTTLPRRAREAARQPFIARAGGGDFFPRVQAKMTVSKPGDKFEQEADKTADKVMRMAARRKRAGRRRSCSASRTDKVQRREEEKILRAAAPDDKIQKATRAETRTEDSARASGREDPSGRPTTRSRKRLRKRSRRPKLPPLRAEEQDPARSPMTRFRRRTDDRYSFRRRRPARRSFSAIAAPAGGGAHHRLPATSNPRSTARRPAASRSSADVRGYMEPRFNADFSNVRVHSDAESASLSNQLSARAFTYQNHIFFSRDQYQPGTSDGKHCSPTS